MKKTLIEYVRDSAYDVDSEVQLYLDKIKKIDYLTYKPFDFKIPHFANTTERRAWEIEQLRRTRYGHEGITGMMYQYTYFWHILSKGAGKRLPEFRRGMQEMFSIIESCLYGEHQDGLYEGNEGKGLILMGRRRWGKSAGLSSAMYNAALHNPYARIGFTSKDEETVDIFFKDSLKTGYDNLPSYLRMTTAAGNSSRRMVFAKKVKKKDGTHDFVGKQSIIFGRAPTETAFEGTGIKMFAIDEIGKYSPSMLSRMWSLTAPALAADDGITRLGVPVLTGTAGDMDTNGDDAKKFWDKADDYGLIRYAVFGWNGFRVDECGNENVVEGLKYILDERIKRKRISSRDYYDFVIQYPLEESDFFVQSGDSPFDIEILNNRMAHLSIDPPQIVRGYFRRVGGNVEFVPKEDGDVQIVEHPTDGNIYAAGCDPTDGSEKANTGSNLSFFIAKGVSLDDDGIDRGAVMQYTAKPQDITIAYEQCAMACEYYSNDRGDCEVLIEKNRARMIAHFELKSYQRYLARKPRRTGRSEERSKIVQYGVHMDEALSDEMIGEIDVDSRSNIENYDFMDLLSEMCTYSRENKRKKGDRVDAWGLTLLNLRTAIKKRLLKKKTNVDQFANIGFSFDKNGKLTR
jgi:hypothetical protein